MKPLTEHPWNFSINVLWNQTFPSLFIAISSSFVYKEINAHTQKFKKLKGSFNAFHPVDSFFLICKFSISTHFSLYILWTKIDKFSPWQGLVLCLISSLETAKKNKLYLMFNTKSTYKNKQARNIFYLKSKLNQVSVLVLPDWSRIGYTTYQKCNSASNYILIFGKLFHIYKLIHVDLKPRILTALFLLASLLYK